MVNEEPDFAGMLIIVCFNLALVLLASGLTLWWAPPAAGSGIPEVKAYLNGVRIKDFFRLSTYIVSPLPGAPFLCRFRKYISCCLPSRMPSPGAVA